MFTAAILSSFRLPPLENAAWQARKAIVIFHSTQAWMKFIIVALLIAHEIFRLAGVEAVL